MDFPKSARDYAENPAPTDSSSRAALDRLGGQPLEGSGFEAERPEPDFQFDWTLPPDQSRGGAQ